MVTNGTGSTSVLILYHVNKVRQRGRTMTIVETTKTLKDTIGVGVGGGGGDDGGGGGGGDGGERNR